MSIHILPQDVAAKIAAGEVVERPANVAKELLENSLDAGAREIRVEVRQGGQRLLRVTDDGHGIPGEEAPLAFERHATSKLEQAEDLYRIATFGFRGEALYSVAAVSHLTMVTRHTSEESGVQFRVEGGRIVSKGAAGAPVGTIVTVEQLFFNTPARKQFLRQPATEAGQIAKIVQRYALAYPERRFSFVNEGKLVFQSNGSGDLRDVLIKIYGLENARQMVPVGLSALRGVESGAEQSPGLSQDITFSPPSPTRPTDKLPETERPLSVAGYASLPTLTRANRSQIDLFVNRRYIEDRSLTHAVVQAYHTLLPGNRSPMAVILVEVDPSQVDVNVHPQKIQVRFRDERQIFSAIQRAVRQAVIGEATAPAMRLPQATEDGNTPSPELSAGWLMRREAILGAGHQERLDLVTPPPTDRPYLGPGTASSLASAGETEQAPPATKTPQPSTDQTPSHPAQSGPDPDQLPPMRVVGQVGAMYIVAEGPEGLFLIDQHAAHERIMYEKFMAQRYGSVDGRVSRQTLLDPFPLHVGHELTGLVANHLQTLDAVGFEVDAFGGDTFLVRAIPSVLVGAGPEAALEEIVRGLGDERNLVAEELEKRLVKMVCKRASIKAGQLLSTIEMQELVRQLEACDSPRTCPHGRPTMIQLSAGELERAFGRV